VLVHEAADCVADLARNLRYYDPASAILLYRGSNDVSVVNLPFADDGIIMHPHPHPQKWGTLHKFALDSMQFALDNIEFDTLTIVDSDQLFIRSGYVMYIENFLSDKIDVGMLGNYSGTQPIDSIVSPVTNARKEIELWRPFLKRFKDGERKFVSWAYWPSTIFSKDGVKVLIEMFKDGQLQEIMSKSKIWATEEIVLPTLIALSGLKYLHSPCSYDYVRYRAGYTAEEMATAFRRPDVFWLHPVPRTIKDPLRSLIRERGNNYEEDSAVRHTQEVARAEIAKVSDNEKYSMSPKIWLYWEGLMPAYIKLCIKTIHAHNNNVRLLDRRSFDLLWRHDRDIPIDSLAMNHKSDFIRAYLLKYYGGLYIDADCIVMKGLSPILQLAENHGFVGYREPQAYMSCNLMASVPGGTVINTHYQMVCDKLRSRKKLEWLDLASIPMNIAIEQNAGKYHLLPTETIMPVGWHESEKFAIRRTEEEHEKLFNLNSYCFMLSNNTFRSREATKIIVDMDEEGLLKSDMFISYLWRRALGSISF